MAVEAFAPAKVNLTLHVTDRRADGYHLLDSLVVFADVGDRLTFTPASGLTLAITGRGAAEVPQDDSNLVLRAARLLAGAGATSGAAVTLEKHLPVAAGLGGGSSDAAAALRGLSHLWGTPLPDLAAQMALGADVPVCVAGQPARMRGLGEILSPAPHLPPLRLVLANPGVPVSTPAAFRALTRPDNPPMPDTLPHFRDCATLARWLETRRNDLEAPAANLCPAIRNVLQALAAQPGCLLARMSGSGATCFGLFAARAPARAAAAALTRAHPNWWVAEAGLAPAPAAAGRTP